MRFLVCLAMTVALAGCASDRYAAEREADAQKDLADALKGRTAGKTVDCISPTFAEGPQIIGNKTLLYREGGRTWRNDVIGACPSLRPLVTVITEIHGGQLCRNDMFRTLDAGSTIPSGYCRLGKFTAYDKTG